ncbi:alpha/beta fold hydrolase [Dactylosporangium sp. CA-233914]|uniref:alpha/beta fold hydrolase n=1 Tax=Dactylosporangium sp. CA-233914 TaxID=3239934 RepID=UPI003D8A1295
MRLRTWTSGTPSGRPPVVLLHGGPGLWDYLRPVARMLDPLTRVHRFDQRGCGGSDPSPQHSHSIARSVADLEALRRHWGHERWIVVGHSFGASLALAYGFAHPERTAGLGYLSGVGVGDWRGPYGRERDRRMTGQRRRRLAELEATPDRSRAQETEFRTLAWFTDHADPVAGWRWALTDARTEKQINYAANAMLGAEAARWSDADVLARARSLDMPCRFIHGREDPRPSRTVAALAAVVPDARMHTIAGAGHQPWRERPAQLQRLLRGLIRSACVPRVAPGRCP